MFTADIDIDVAPKTKREKYGVRAIIYDAARARIVPHPSGHYIDCGMAHDQLTEMATVDYQVAEEWGFNKVDMLMNSSYELFESKDDVLKMLAKEPNWDLLQDPEYLECLPQIANYKDLVAELKPRSVEDLADILALMRPGKAYLLDQYRKHKAIARLNLYTKTEKVYFKRSHAIAYASMLVCLLNKFEEIKHEA